MKRALTSKFLDTVKPPKTGQDAYFDSLVPGFGFRIGASGVKSWSVLYRNAQGKKKRFTLGRYPAIKLVDARDGARKVLTAVARGEDPAAFKKAEKKHLRVI